MDTVYIIVNKNEASLKLLKTIYKNIEQFKSLNARISVYKFGDLDKSCKRGLKQKKISEYPVIIYDKIAYVGKKKTFDFVNAIIKSVDEHFESMNNEKKIAPLNNGDLSDYFMTTLNEEGEEHPEGKVDYNSLMEKEHGKRRSSTNVASSTHESESKNTKLTDNITKHPSPSKTTDQDGDIDDNLMKGWLENNVASGSL